VLTSDWFLGLELQTGSVNALRPSGTSQSDWHCNYPNASVLKCCKLIYAVANYMLSVCVMFMKAI